MYACSPMTHSSPTDTPSLRLAPAFTSQFLPMMAPRTLALLPMYVLASITQLPVSAWPLTTTLLPRTEYGMMRASASILA